MIELQHVSKSFEGLKVIDDLSLEIAQGEFTVILGSSGSGKSTLLKMMNRLVEHDSGRILFAGDEIRSLQPEALRRRMGYAIQSVGLFPHWSVEKNIATVPALLKWPKAQIDARVTELMTLLQLPPERYRKRFAHQLSGGQQQRVAIARALVNNPVLILADEPTGNLDTSSGIAIAHLLNELCQSGKTILVATHDPRMLNYATNTIFLLDGKRVTQEEYQESIQQVA